MTIWRFWISDCMIHLLLVFAIDCCVCVCVRERERERERDRVTSQHISYLNRSVCERKREMVTSQHISLIVASVCVCVCEREGEREMVTLQRSVQPVKNHLYRGLCANTYELHHCVCHTTLFSSWAWLKLTIMERGVTFLMQLVVFSQSQCSGSAGQSEQTVLVGRRDFVEN